MASGLALGLVSVDGHAANSQCNGLDPNTTPCAGISGVSGDNFTLTFTGGNNTNSNQQRSCALSNNPVGSEMVNITPTGTGAGGALVATGMGGEIPFVIQYRQPSGGSWTLLDTSSPTAFPTLNEAQFNTCDNSGSSSGGQKVRVRVQRADIDDAPAGVYTGTFTLTADPPAGGISQTSLSGNVTITLNEGLNLTKVKSNFSGGTWDLVGNETNRDNSICVWSNNRTTFGGSSSYNVTVTTDHGSFVLMSGSDTLPYSIYWGSDLQPANVTVNTGTELTYGVAETFMTTAGLYSCPTNGETNAQMLVFWDEDDLSAAVGSLTPYTSVATVTISAAP